MTPKPRSAPPGSSMEARVLEALETGETLNLAPGQKDIDEAAMRRWGGSHKISADLLRDVLRKVVKAARDPDPHGMRIRGAVVDGRLDLENIDTDIRLELVDTLLPHGLCVRDAKLPGLVLSNCVLEHPASSPLDAERFTTRAVRLQRVRVIAKSEAGAVLLRNGHVGALTCVRLNVENRDGAAFDGEALTVEQAMVLTDACTVVGARENGAVLLHSASIGAQLDCSGASMRSADGPALNANNLHVARDVFLGDGFTAAGAGPAGAVRLSGAVIGGQLVITGSLTNNSGPALSADGMQVKTALMLRDGLRAHGDGKAGAVRLAGAHVGQLELDGAHIDNADGPALNAPMLQVDKDLFLRDGFTAAGVYALGTVRLPGARLGRLDCTGSKIANTAGPAVFADSITIAQGLVLQSFTACGTGPRGVVSLASADIGGEVRLDFADLHTLRADDPLAVVDGLKYSSVPLASGLETWLRLLAERTPRYAAQPYQQLAAVYRAAGDESAVRKILMAQRRDQIERDVISSRRERWWSRLSGWLLGWGYQPWRALGAVGLVILVLIGLSFLKPEAYVYAKASPRYDKQPQCSVMDRAGTAIDAGLPVVKMSARGYCDFDSQKAGYGMTIIQGLLQVLSWAFVTLFVAGFTGVIRKT